MNWLRRWILGGLLPSELDRLAEARRQLDVYLKSMREAEAAIRHEREGGERRDRWMQHLGVQQELLALLARFEALCELLGVELVAPPGGTDAAVVAVSLDGRRQAIQALQASMELDEIRRIKAKCLDRLRILDRDMEQRRQAS